MAKQINCNVSGTPTDVPYIQTDDPRIFLGEFEGTPVNRCIFRLPGDANGGAYLRWADQSVRFLLPPDNWTNEGAVLGLPTLAYAATAGDGLKVIGAEFVKSTGEKWLWAGATDFRLVERLLRGEDITPILTQRKNAGANLVRVLAMKTNNTGWALDPRGGSYWTAVEDLFGQLRDKGLYCEWTVFADTKNVMPQESEQQAFWNQTVEVAKRYPNVVLELLNEYGHSTQAINPLRFIEPSGPLACHGSGLTDAHPVEPFWDFATYHARRDTNAIGFTSYDPYEFERDYPKKCPMIADEGIKPPNYGFSLDFATRMGQHAACGAGGTFHTDAGVDSRGWSAEEFACAARFFGQLRTDD